MGVKFEDFSEEELDSLELIEKKDNTPKVQFTIHNEKIKKRVDSDEEEDEDIDDEEDDFEEEEFIEEIEKILNVA